MSEMWSQWMYIYYLNTHGRPASSQILKTWHPLPFDESNTLFWSRQSSLITYPNCDSSHHQTPASILHSKSTSHCTCTAHTFDCTWGAWHSSSGSGRSCYRHQAPFLEGTSRQCPLLVLPYSCGCSPRCSESKDLDEIRHSTENDWEKFKLLAQTVHQQLPNKFPPIPYRKK